MPGARRQGISTAFATRPRVADLPIKRIVGGRHQIVDFVLPYGRVLHDYLA